MIYGSVCSGIEAATAAWHGLGWKPAFFSDIEDFPRAVLAHHYPHVPCHGDFTTIGDDYGAINLLVGGTPCQAFSVAGLRKGLDDGAERIWMLLKSTFFHAKSRLDLFNNTPLARVYPLSWRLDFTGEGRPTMECSWFEWQRGWIGEPMYGPVLEKPLSEKNCERCKNTVDLFGE